MQFFSASEDSEHLSENYNSDKKKHVTKANHRVLSPRLPQGAPKGPLVPPRGPEGAPGSHWVPWAPGSLGPEALRAGGLGKHGTTYAWSGFGRGFHARLWAGGVRRSRSRIIKVFRARAPGVPRGWFGLKANNKSIFLLFSPNNENQIILDRLRRTPPAHNRA